MARKNTISWREDRIKLYNNLSLLSLGGTVAGWKEWDTTASTTSDRSAVKFYRERIESDFAPGSIHKYLLDHIHENDDIMWKYYRNKDIGKPGGCHSNKGHDMVLIGDTSIEVCRNGVKIIVKFNMLIITK
jgi:hypothetical protein